MANVLVTGTGREGNLGYCFVLTYLKRGDTVFATVRKPSPPLEKLQEEYPDTLHIITMDQGSTESVRAAAAEVAKHVDCLDTVINNALITSPDYPVHNPLEDCTLDNFEKAFDVSSVGPLRVIQALQPLLYANPRTAMVANISSGAGCITTCKNDRDFDYCMIKCAMNMSTKILYNKYEAEKKVRVLCMSPGWMRTNAGNAAAPYDPYVHSEKMRKVFESRRESFDGVVFVDHDNNEVPW